MDKMDFSFIQNLSLVENELNQVVIQATFGTVIAFFG